MTNKEFRDILSEFPDDIQIGIELTVSCNSDPCTYCPGHDHRKDAVEIFKEKINKGRGRKPEEVIIIR